MAITTTRTVVPRSIASIPQRLARLKLVAIVAVAAAADVPHPLRKTVEEAAVEIAMTTGSYRSTAQYVQYPLYQPRRAGVECTASSTHDPLSES
jgi:hypothetical protein